MFLQARAFLSIHHETPWVSDRFADADSRCYADRTFGKVKALGEVEGAFLGEINEIIRESEMQCLSNLAGATR